ncbi:MAG: hypothetical protein KDI79_31910, partial [Anaerolineae bacterium]|nr:hypothetical protein [Anaerolineae bacterium]
SFWFHNRLGGDRGAIEGPGSGNVIFGEGMVTAQINSGTDSLRGVWTALNHPIRDCSSLDFTAIFPPQIKPEFQGRVTGLRVHIHDGQGQFQVILQNGESSHCPPQVTKWTSATVALTGGAQELFLSLPLDLGEIGHLNWQVMGNAGNFVVVDRVELIVEIPQFDLPHRAFLWSYAMLLANWDSDSGFTRDSAYFTANEFDNVSASGMQAAAAVMAWRLGFISEASATEIVVKTSQALLALPRCHGVWPHFIKDGQIISGTEWSSIDSVIALIALIEARQALDLNTIQVTEVLTGIDWPALILGNGSISHGFVTDCSERLEDKDGGVTGGWHDFGTESWLVNWAYAAATGNVANFDHTPPTFNGSGFIDELGWLLAPPPCDRWGTNWHTYRQQAVNRQLDYYQKHSDYGGPPRLFGLSAAEVPDLSIVASSQIYQAFGVGGEIPPNDGSTLLGYPVIIPHYAAMVASLQPTQTMAFWQWLETKRLFTALNNTESLMITTDEQIVWNALKGSWNLSLQTLGWGRLLAGSDHPLYQSLWDVALLRQGYIWMRGPTCKSYFPIITR